MRLAFIPLDDRPCTAAFPSRLAPLAGVEIHAPPGALLGHCTRPGDPDALLDWLEREARGAPAIISVDMLVFGGLVGSRSPAWSADETLERTARVEAWLRSLPEKARPLLSSIIMRVPPYIASESERALSEVLLSWSRSKARGEEARARRFERALPEAFRVRYLETRARNARVNRRVLSWAEEGLAAYTLAGMDDSRTEGFNVQERAALEPAVAACGPRADLVPGADELSLLLLARHALSRAGRVPSIGVRFAPPELERNVTRYEDRGVGRLVEGHLGVLGLTPAPDPEGAEIMLLVHGPPGPQREAAVQMLPPRVAPRKRDLALEARRAMERGQLVAVADLGHANGADRGLVEALARHVDLPSLAAYAAWNTAGNTIGTVLAHAMLRWLSLRCPAPGTSPEAATRAHAAFLFERFADDWAYEAVVRQRVAARCVARGGNIHALGEACARAEAEVRDELAGLALPLYTRAFAGRRVDGPAGTSFSLGRQPSLRISLPWQRLFEVDVEVGVELA